MPKGIFDLSDLSDLSDLDDIITIQHEEYFDIESLKRVLNKKETSTKNQDKSSISRDLQRNHKVRHRTEHMKTSEEIVMSKTYEELEEESQVRIKKLEKELLVKERRILNLWEAMETLQKIVEKEKQFTLQVEKEERLWKKRMGIYKEPDSKYEPSKQILQDENYINQLTEFKKYVLMELAGISITINKQEYLDLIEMSPKDLVSSMSHFLSAWKGAHKKKESYMSGIQHAFKEYLYDHFVKKSPIQQEDELKQAVDESQDSIEFDLKDELIEKVFTLPDDKYSLSTSWVSEASGKDENQSIKWSDQLKNWLSEIYHWIKNKVFGCFSSNAGNIRYNFVSSLDEDKPPVSGSSPFYYFQSVKVKDSHLNQPLTYNKRYMERTPSFRTLHTLFAQLDEEKSGHNEVKMLNESRPESGKALEIKR